MTRPRIGLSTVAAGQHADIEAIVDLGCEVVEVCGYDTDMWQRVAPRIRSAGVPVGLHCPVPFDGALRRFDITSPIPNEQAVAFDLVERTLRAAEHSAAAYVVVHFPSPHPPSGNCATPDPSRRDFVLRCGERLAAAHARSGVPVLVENLSHHPDFGSADDYREFFQLYPGLRMCLDVGHAHVSPHSRDVYEFVSAIEEFVGSVHLYNTDATGRHRTPRWERGTGDGWIDLTRLLDLFTGVPDYLVFEYHATVESMVEQYEATAWLRDRIREMPWG